MVQGECRPPADHFSVVERFSRHRFNSGLRNDELKCFVKKVKFRVGKGFRVAIRNDRAQCAEMVMEPGETQGGTNNHHRGADQWLYVVSGSGSATVDGKRL